MTLSNVVALAYATGVAITIKGLWDTLAAGWRPADGMGALPPSGARAAICLLALVGAVGVALAADIWTREGVAACWSGVFLLSQVAHGLWKADSAPETPPPPPTGGVI